MNHHVRLRQRATVFTCDCTRCGAVRAQPSAVVSKLCVVFVTGAALGAARKRQRLPPPRGDIQRAATPDTFCRPPRPHAEEVPDCSSYPLRIPWIASAVGCQATHARLLPKGISLAANFSRLSQTLWSPSELRTGSVCAWPDHRPTAMCAHWLCHRHRVPPVHGVGSPTHDALKMEQPIWLPRSSPSSKKAELSCMQKDMDC